MTIMLEIQKDPTHAGSFMIGFVEKIQTDLLLKLANFALSAKEAIRYLSPHCPHCYHYSRCSMVLLRRRSARVPE